MYARVHFSQFNADRRGVRALRNCACDASKGLKTSPKTNNKLDGVLGTQTSHFILLSYYSSRSHGTVVCTTCKGRNYCRPRDPASWPNMAATADDCKRTATVVLPTAASPGFISGEVGISAILDAFSTVYELPLTRFKKGQTNKQTDRHTDMNDHYTSLYELRPREVISA